MELREQAQQMRREGKSYRLIAETIGATRMAVWNWAHEEPTPDYITSRHGGMWASRPDVPRISDTRRLRHHKRLRRDVLRAYGDKCACCGEAEPAFLALDHVHNDGAAHRRELKEDGRSMYYWLRDNGFPQDGRFQLLCHNCNMAKQHVGQCPHATSGQASTDVLGQSGNGLQREDVGGLSLRSREPHVRATHPDDEWMDALAYVGA